MRKWGCTLTKKLRAWIITGTIKSNMVYNNNNEPVFLVELLSCELHSSSSSSSSLMINTSLSVVDLTSLQTTSTQGTFAITWTLLVIVCENLKKKSYQLMTNFFGQFIQLCLYRNCWCSCFFCVVSNFLNWSSLFLNTYNERQSNQ